MCEVSISGALENKIYIHANFFYLERNCEIWRLEERGVIKQEQNN